MKERVVLAQDADYNAWRGPAPAAVTAKGVMTTGRLIGIRSN